MRDVSIPIGFSDALRLISLAGTFTAEMLFQSLSGFLMRCDADRGRDDRLRDGVSIPIGFSDALRHHETSEQAIKAGFNPYRVF